MKIEGKIKVKGITIPVNEKFQKREFVVTDESSSYVQQILFQLTQDNCTKLDKFNEGDSIKVDFEVRGKEWKSPSGEVKYFNTLVATAIKPTETND